MGGQIPGNGTSKLIIQSIVIIGSILAFLLLYGDSHFFPSAAGAALEKRLDRIESKLDKLLIEDHEWGAK